MPSRRHAFLSAVLTISALGVSGCAQNAADAQPTVAVPKTSEHRLGEPATVTRTDLVNDATSDTQLTVTVSTASKAAWSTFKNTGVAQDSSKVPYFVTATVTNKGTTAISDYWLPRQFTVIDSSGGTAERLTVLGSFKPCPAPPITPLAANASTKGCLVYLVPAATTLSQIQVRNGGLITDAWVFS